MVYVYFTTIKKLPFTLRKKIIQIKRRIWVFCKLASQRETDGILKLGQFEESLIKGLFTKVWTEHKEMARERGEPQG